MNRPSRLGEQYGGKAYLECRWQRPEGWKPLFDKPYYIPLDVKQIRQDSHDEKIGPIEVQVDYGFGPMNFSSSIRGSLASFAFGGFFDDGKETQTQGYSRRFPPRYYNVVLGPWGRDPEDF